MKLKIVSSGVLKTLQWWWLFCYCSISLLSIAVALLAEFQAFPGFSVLLSPSLKDNVKLSTLRKGLLQWTWRTTLFYGMSVGWWWSTGKLEDLESSISSFCSYLSSSTALLLFAFSDAKSSTQEFLKSSLHSGPETCLSDESPLGPFFLRTTTVMKDPSVQGEHHANL